MRLQKDFLYKEIRSTLTIANSNIKMAWYLDWLYMRYMIPMESIDAILVAECFVKYVFKLYRLPNLIISNCGS
jgi:phage gp36-like protein